MLTSTLLVISLVVITATLLSAVARLVKYRKAFMLMADRLDILNGLLQPDRYHQRNPEMRLVQARTYAENLKTWMNA